MDPRSKALAELMQEVSNLEDALEGFEQELAVLEASGEGGEDPEQRALLQQTVSELQQELSQKRTRLQVLSDASTGCAGRNSNPFDRDWIEDPSED